MMNGCYKFLYLLLAINIYTSPALLAQDIKADAGLQQSSLKIGEQTRLIFTVHQLIKRQVTFPRIGDSILSKVQVLGSTKADTVADKNYPQQLIITKAYTITCFDAGTYIIPAYSFVSGSQTVQTEPLTMQVTSVAVDTTKAIYDIKQPLTVNYTILDWLRDNWIWLIAVLAVIGAVIGLVFYLKNRPKPIPVFTEPVTPALPAHQIALNRLQALRDKKLWQVNEVKQHYIELTGVLRDYLEKRYLIKTHEKTTDELLESLQNKTISTADNVYLRNLLVLADLVKFAKLKPQPDENEQGIDSAMAFVLNTKQADVPKATGGGIADV